jgi:predicted ATPase/DNA-binding CsgD family transcriptional regulator
MRHQEEAHIMTRPIPIVRNGNLYEHTEATASSDAIGVESVAWYAWLESHRLFRFEHPACPFIARREQRSDGWYWYAYRRRGGRLLTAHIGVSAELSLTRLHAIAVALVGIDKKPARRLTADGRVVKSPVSRYPQMLNVTEPAPVSQHILPRPLTSLVGRERETATVVALLRRPEVHLVSIVGTAGVGKTRLALQVATDMMENFGNGVFFVALASLRNAELVLPTIAQTLGLRARGNQCILDLLAAALRDKHCLLILDNCEQVVSAVPRLVELLQVCPFMKMIVTGRTVLHVRGEYTFLVHPLALPDLTHEQDCVSLSTVAAVQCFLHRVQAVKPSFQLTDSIAHVIAEICVRLDGLPLALELAATYLKLLSPQQLLLRLEHRLDLLTVGAADLPERQQTLRNTLQWSYELLNEEEQQLFRRLAVFVGGCTLERVEGMYSLLGESRDQLLNGITALLDKQLLYQQQGESKGRLLMLETIREYGLECLAICGETEAVQSAHAHSYLAQAEQEASKKCETEQAPVWHEQEQDNLWLALNWFEQHKESEKAWRLHRALCEGSVGPGTLYPPHPPCKPRARSPEGLTRCELDVLRLLAQGLKSSQIAEQLVIAITTVNSHLSSIYSKLGVNCRAAATRYAIEHGLV